jgi:iron complex outermembrane receptor protein
MMKFIRRAFAVTVFIAIATQIVAKEVTTESGDVPTLEELLNTEVIQGASKYAQPVNEVPAFTQIVTAREIRAHGWRHLKDLLNSVAGFYFTNDRFYSYMGVRGFAPLGDYNTNVLVMIDGHRLNENIFDSVGYGWDFPLDMEMIDRVEVVLGPGSTLYGNNALFAVVNVYTKKIEGSLGLKTQAESMTRQTGRGLVAVKDGSGQVRWEASASAFYSGGYQSLYFPAFDSPEFNNGVAENGDAERQRRAFGEFQWDRWTLQGLYNHRWKNAPGGIFGTDFLTSGTNIVDRRGYLDLSYAGDPDAETYVSGRGYVDNYTYYGDYTTNGVVNHDSVEGDWVGGEAQVVTRKLPRQTWVVGAEGRDNIHQSMINYDVGVFPDYINTNHTATQWAVFAQDEILILRNFRGYLGLRYDRQAYTPGILMPRVALVYDLDEKTAFKTMFGESYRAPNQYEMFYVDNITREAPGLLKPEKIFTYEVNASRVLNRLFSLEGSAFVYEVQDLLYFQLDADSITSGTTVNLPRASAQGVELMLKYHAEWGMTAHAGYDYQVTRSSYGGEMENSPQNLGKVGCEIPLQGERWLGGIEWQCMSSRKTENGSALGGYGIVNLNVSGQDWPFRHVECSGGVFNVLNRAYFDPVSDEAQEAIMEDGRCFHLKVALEF